MKKSVRNVLDASKSMVVGVSVVYTLSSALSGNPASIFLLGYGLFVGVMIGLVRTFIIEKEIKK